MSRESVKKVSVVTVCINLIQEHRKDAFEQMFDSVVRQSYSNIEHVIIDGNSKDGTVEFIRALTGGRENVVFISEPDTGIYNAMNKGVKFSTGEYIVIMNSDDNYCDHHAVEDLVRALENSGADFAAADAILERPKGNIVQRADLSVYPCAMPFCHQTFLCRKVLFERYGYFDESYRISADYKFIISVLKDNVKGAVVNKELVFFRHAGESALDNAAIMREVESILQESVYSAEPKLRPYAGEIYNRFVNVSCSLSLLLRIKLFTRDKELQKTLLRYLGSPLHLKAWVKSLLQFRFIIKPVERTIKKFTRR